MKIIKDAELIMRRRSMSKKESKETDRKIKKRGTYKNPNKVN